MQMRLRFLKVRLGRLLVLVFFLLSGNIYALNFTYTTSDDTTKTISALNNTIDFVSILQNTGAFVDSFRISGIATAPPEWWVDFCDHHGCFQLSFPFPTLVLDTVHLNPSAQETIWVNFVPQVTLASGKVTITCKSLSYPDSFISLRFRVVPSVLVPEQEEISNLSGFILAQNYPNPFNPSTTISFQIKSKGQGTSANLPKTVPILTSLTIYNILGQKVKTLVDEDKLAGEYSVVWNGKDEYGEDVSSGIYFYRLKVKGFTETKRMLLLR